MQLFYWMVIVFAGMFHGACADEALSIEPYAKNRIPLVQSIEKERVVLSDGTVWKKSDEGEELSRKWLAQDPVIVRWDKAKSKYFLHAVSNNQQLQDREKTTLVDLQTPSDLSVRAVDADTLALSDGALFEHIPFVAPLHVGDRVLISWNENEKGKRYPYIIIGYHFVETPDGGKWEVSGEVQARLKK